MRNLFSRPLTAALAVFVALAIISGAVYALASASGFIPGIGFVRDVESVLEQPVSVSPEASAQTGEGETTADSPAGLSVTVAEAASGAEGLTVLYEVRNLPADAIRWGVVSPEGDKTEARLADGTVLALRSGSMCSAGADGVSAWMSCKVIFDPLPAGTTEFTLFIPQLSYVDTERVQGNWEIPVRMNPDAVPQAVGIAGAVGNSSATVNGLTLRLVEAVQGPEQTAFQFELSQQGAKAYLHHTGSMKLRDAAGRYYILSGGPNAGSYSMDNPGVFRLSSLVTTPIQEPGELTFELDYVIMAVNDPVALKFDPGADAVLGQEWTLDETVNSGGMQLHFVRAELLPGYGEGMTLRFEVEAPQGVTGAMLHGASGGGGSTGLDRRSGRVVIEMMYEPVAGQAAEIMLTEVMQAVEGPWTVKWTPQDPSLVQKAQPAPVPTRMAPDLDIESYANPLLQEVAERLEKEFPETLYQPGWLRVETRQVNRGADTWLDMEGKPAEPAETQVETWLRLDENGYVLEDLTFRRATDGSLLSKSLNQGIYHFELPSGWGGLGQDRWMEKADLAQKELGTLAGYLSMGGKLLKSSQEVDGNTYEVYQVTMPLEPPYVLPGDERLILQQYVAIWFDQSNGKLNRLTGGSILEDGEVFEQFVRSFLAVEPRLELSPEALEFQRQVITP